MNRLLLLFNNDSLVFRGFAKVSITNANNLYALIEDTFKLDLSNMAGSKKLFKRLIQER